MSRSVNKVILLGNLTHDPEVRTIPSGALLCKLRVATNERYKDTAGQWIERPTYHSVILWERRAEVAERYLKRGDRIYIEGSLQTRKYQDRDGNDRWKTEVKGREMIMLGTRGGRRDSQRDGDSFGGRGSSGDSRTGSSWGSGSRSYDASGSQRYQSGDAGQATEGPDPAASGKESEYRDSGTGGQAHWDDSTTGPDANASTDQASPDDANADTDLPF